ncbi:MAG: spore germination protein, partial [Rummeliibacillus sp.]
TMAAVKEPFQMEKFVDYICHGETIILLLTEKQMVHLTLPEIPHRSPDEPINEHILRGSHEGFVENVDVNIGLIRKRIRMPNLVVNKMEVGKETKTDVYYMYLDNVANQQSVSEVESKLKLMQEKTKSLYTAGEVGDYLEESVYSPFPQMLNTERPDRVFANLVEGKIAVFTNISPTVLLGPVTFFSFYQSPDDYNGRVLVGSFYRMVRVFSFLTAVFLPAFYIAIVSFHFEILPIELSKKLRLDISEIPYRPIIEAMILEIIIELIREASVRLPQAIVQTIGIVGGLVIGNVIVTAGLVSNMMVIIVALTAISSYVVPSVEMNMSIRILRFPFMLAAALAGFFGIVIGGFVLFIHLLNLHSLKSPYFSPIVPFEPKKIKQIFVRGPFVKPSPQTSSFDPEGRKK